MACGQFGAKPLPEPMFVFLSICQKKQSSNEFEYTKILLEKKRFEIIVSEMLAIFFKWTFVLNGNQKLE